MSILEQWIRRVNQIYIQPGITSIRVQASFTLRLLRTSRKIENLRDGKNTVYYCIDDPNPPYRGVRGKGRVEIHQDIDYNIPIAEKRMVRYLGTLAHPMATPLMTSVKNGNSVILEITPNYYSTWDYTKK